MQEPQHPPAAVRKVPCPACKREAVLAPSNAWRPFCSERCRRGDLGAWASDQYRMPVATSSEEPGDGLGDDGGTEAGAQATPAASDSA